METRKEVWLRNETIPDLSPILQPAANALLEAAEEINIFLKDFPASRLWEKPAGCASVGFHLLHITGFLDRLLTYAEGNALSEQQLAYLQSENDVHPIDVKSLLGQTANNIYHAVERLKSFTDNTLIEIRYVGRSKIPTTTIGLLFHAAEHTMRHTGQLLVTSKIIKNQEQRYI
ncbi:MAG: DinB family protein [Chitinophagaceae bacterium]